MHGINGSMIGLHAKDEDLTFHDLPPFSENVPTAPLLRLSLKKLVNGDEAEQERLWRACCDVGFFYLDLRGGRTNKRDSVNSASEEDVDGDALLGHADELFELGNTLFDLQFEEKQKYDLKPRGSYFGYKATGAGVVDKHGTRDRVEWYNVSKDDILGISGDRLPAPEILQDEGNRTLLRTHMQRSHAIVMMLLSQMNGRLGLPPNTLQNLHKITNNSGDQIRIIRSPPQPDQDDTKKSLGQHTDFGSITILFNRLGGLQILPPNSDQWSYVKPLKNHCIVNLGDAMVQFSAGILRSNLHRVVNPPGKQAGTTRMSLVYFARPEDGVLMKALEGSERVEEARRENGVGEEEDVTAKDWILRRALGRRVGGDYENSGGSESDRVKS
ncbi:Clavaminate synthase-like protein [Teratosphaeria nubilosa]|uniref:Clavaminate synthase-like protein n=1 Tax=Teratosphaeria nubilosa TaxID=161662 RepID=A0A6G1KV25_9PEZI|nr:Clavaminate synthase-like protein [Teratosphaeria nubilosa]